LAGAGLVHLARQAEVRGAEQQVDETDDSERQLRQKLTSAWASMSAMAFRDAEQQFEAALQMEPKQFLPLTGLYHIRKLKPESEAFHHTARQLLDAEITDEGELRQQFNIYRDYVKRIDSEEAIPLETRVRLIGNLSKLGETKEADRLAMLIEKQGERHPMLGKSLSLLAQALQNSNQARSNHLKMLAVRLAEESA
ncbi:MAG: hypothetical protein V2I38_04225, partial [Alcanivoracaceae bacterium]|nr:hypothetical protein [Alcanivoracaceae bacterium]